MHTDSNKRSEDQKKGLYPQNINTLLFLSMQLVHFTMKTMNKQKSNNKTSISENECERGEKCNKTPVPYTIVYSLHLNIFIPFIFYVCSFIHVTHYTYLCICY